MLYAFDTVLSTEKAAVNQTDKILHSSGERQARNKLKYKYLRGKYMY